MDAPSFDARIFRPLGLDRTLLPARALGTLPEQHARGYLFGTVVDWVAGDGVLPPDQVSQAVIDQLYPTP